MLDGIAGYFLIGIVGLLAGVLLAKLIAHRRAALRRGDSVRDLLGKHFGWIDPDSLEIQTREYPYRVRLDAFAAVTEWLDRDCQIGRVIGVPAVGGFMSEIGLAQIIATCEEPVIASALEYDTVNVGEAEPRKCVKNALWFVDCKDHTFALVWYPKTDHSGCGFTTMLRIELAYLAGESGRRLCDVLIDSIAEKVQEAKTYRGKILSLENSDSYDGNTDGIKVHQLRKVQREDVILPKDTVHLLERNVLRFVDQRSELTRLGVPVKKGLLFYGPPGTGKTHTIHYLIGALSGHTTLLITAEQVALLDDYMGLAHLLQPNVVILEDIDLIARQRDEQGGNQEPLLNKLLNEMDGLREDAAILFLLTTNRPESLDQAHAARPGRIDQAIEFPVPTAEGRRKLVRLYAAGARIQCEVIEETVIRTAGVSASFIKELMRRAIQFHLECRGDTSDQAIEIFQNDIDQAIDELLFSGGSLNRTLLGADDADAS